MNACDDLLVGHADGSASARCCSLAGLREVALEHAAGGHRILAAALAGRRAPTRRTSTLRLLAGRLREARATAISASAQRDYFCNRRMFSW